jgi:basic membrane lipoprotein Med (substrate-binding protein (PBP1-ABC) superfamily)
MTRLLPIFLIAALVLGVAGFVLPAEGQSPAPPRFVVVVDESAGRDQAAVDAATRAVKAARGADGELRITRTPTEQLSVTSYFAARGFDVIGVGLDREIAVDPVAERYPDTRFTLTDSGGLPSRAAAAAATR